jgi:hypothetical protein
MYLPESDETLVAATIQEKQWTDTQLLQVDLKNLMHLIGQDQLPASVQIED